MNIAKFSINRPIFISSIVILILTLGTIAFNRLNVEFVPDISYPVVTIATIYPGAAPEEIENLISKPIEEEISALGGIKHLTSRNLESVSVIIAEFNLNINSKDAEQQVRERVSLARRKLPDDIEEPLIRRFNPSDEPILGICQHRCRLN